MQSVLVASQWRALCESVCLHVGSLQILTLKRIWICRPFRVLLIYMYGAETTTSSVYYFTYNKYPVYYREIIVFLYFLFFFFFSGCPLCSFFFQKCVGCPRIDRGGYIQICGNHVGLQRRSSSVLESFWLSFRRLISRVCVGVTAGILAYQNKYYVSELAGSKRTSRKTEV